VEQRAGQHRGLAQNAIHRLPVGLFVLQTSKDGDEWIAKPRRASVMLRENVNAGARVLVDARQDALTEAHLGVRGCTPARQRSEFPSYGMALCLQQPQRTGAEGLILGCRLNLSAAVACMRAALNAFCARVQYADLHAWLDGNKCAVTQQRGARGRASPYVHRQALLLEDDGDGGMLRGKRVEFFDFILIREILASEQHSPC
jgi:hypothetical protein